MTDGAFKLSFRLPVKLIDLIRWDAVNEYSTITVEDGGWRISDRKLDEVYIDLSEKPSDSLEVMAFAEDQTERHERLERVEALLLAAQKGNLMTAADVQALLGVSKATVYRIIGRDDFPNSVELGQRSQRWLRADVEKWIEGQRKTPITAKTKAKTTTSA